MSEGSCGTAAIQPWPRTGMAGQCWAVDCAMLLGLCCPFWEGGERGFRVYPTPYTLNPTGERGLCTEGICGRVRQQNDASLGSPGNADSTAVPHRARAVLLVTGKTAPFFVWTGEQDVNAAQHRPGAALLQAVHHQIQGVRAPSSADTAAAVQPQPVQCWPPEGRRAVGLQALVSADRHELPNRLCLRVVSDQQTLALKRCLGSSRAGSILAGAL